jgi:glycosyltransferase involved in cell wall biosynthesis
MEPGIQQLVLVANARIPSQRAQSLQVMHAGQAFVEQGCATTLLHAKRRDTPEPVPGQLASTYGLPSDSALKVRSVACFDTIDLVPRSLQFAPARLQEWTFASRAARIVDVEYPEAIVVTREVETAFRMAARPGLFWEVHRVPGGRWRRKLMARCLPKLAGCIAISGGVREDLIRSGVPESKILVDHDAFDASRFQGLPSRTAARQILELDGARPLVVYTGGLLGWKGVEILIQAAAQIPDADFIIVGGMDADVRRLRPSVVNLPNVRLLGFQAPMEVPLYMAAADLGVVPNRSQPAISSRYTSPLKIFEAMAVGLPLVVSDLPSMRDIVGAGEVCFVEPDDGNALARGIAQLLEDAPLREELGRRLSARAPQHTFDARASRLIHWMRSRMNPAP